ncbi:MAG: phosphoglucosamine mutase [Phycisphaerae bacterium]|jgi:phosphomannomutase
MALMVGISGVRGLVGETLTPAVALEFAQAYGTLLGGGRVVLARDSRPSGETFAHAAAAGLLATGCTVTELGIAMTPTVGRTIHAGGYDGGMSITASHNPIAWNGLKFFDNLGLAPDPERAHRIADIRTQGAYRFLKEDFPAITICEDAGEQHVDAVLDAVEVDLAPLRGSRVVLDSVNGAGCLHSPGLLATLGCEVVHINSEPTGRFAHPPEPLAENLSQLGQAVRDAGAVIGFAQDPDADRLAIVDENGTYIGEEFTLALAVQSVLSRRRGAVAANLSTSRMIDDVAARYGAQVLRTPVGEAHVARAVKAGNCVIGGEGNGGVIDPRICLVRDSLSAMSLVLQLMAATGRSISALVADLPHYATVKQKATCPRERIDEAVAAVAKAYAEHKPNTSDGVRVDLSDGWVHVRASNTEPIIRFFAEARDPQIAEKFVRNVREIAAL